MFYKTAMYVRRIQPGPGQESVWDYPRPPALESVSERVEIVFAGEVLASTEAGHRVLETSHPPIYYIPRGDVRGDMLIDSPRTSYCEWKGLAHYVDVKFGDRIARDAGWYYPEPTTGFEPIRDALAFYVAPMDRCSVGSRIAQPQPGNFYGGWVTEEIVGPFKGSPGTDFW